MVISTSIPALSQSAQNFGYAIPRFSSNPGSELILSNLSTKLATPEVTLVESSKDIFVHSFVTIQPGSQLRLTTANFGVNSFEGTVLVIGSVPLSITATLADADGNFESVGPALNSSSLIVPFARGTSGAADVTIFNSEPTSTTVIITAVGPDGQSVEAVQRVISGLGTLTENVNAMFPQPAFGLPRDISHLLIRSISNVFGSDKRLFVQAALDNFGADTEGIVGAHFDPAIVTGVPTSSGTLSATVPFFVQGGDYATVVQVINTSATAGSATLTAIGLDGNPIAGANNPATVQIPANGSFRRGARNLFNFSSTVVIGLISVQSTIPVVTTTALASVAQNGMVLIPTAEAPNTNFVFRTIAANPVLFTGFALQNPTSSTARLTIRNVSDDGSSVSSMTLTIAPFASIRRNLLELLPEARTAGFIHISSDVAIVASAVEGKTDNSMLANLPAMHSQPDYVPPAPTRFLITGSVKHNGVPFPALNVSITGTLNATVSTDEAGNFLFQNVPAGNYTIRPQAAGFTFSPASIAVTITSDSSRGNNFAATLITPTITLVAPTSVQVGSPATTLFVVGSPLIPTSEIVFDGTPLPTTISSLSVPVTVAGGTGGTITVLQVQPALQAVIPASALAVARTTSFFVRNSGPGGSVSSAARTFVVGNPAPVLTSVTGVPDPLLIGNPGFTIFVNGTGFSSSSVVQVNGNSISTDFVSPVQLRASVPPQFLAEGGVLNITAINPAPTVGPSNALTVPLFNPIPGITSISPSTTEVRLDPNALPLQLTVKGFGFRQGAVVQLEGVDVPTEFHSTTELLASVPQARLELAKILIVKVKNPPPTLGTSEAQPLSLYNLIPTVTSLDASLIMFDPVPRFKDDKPKFPAQIIIRGTNFAKEGGFYVFATPCDAEAGGFTGERISSTMIVGKINIACTGTYSLGAGNPQPGGGLSAILSFNVVPYTVPANPVTIAGLAPAAIVKGSGSFTLTISGSNFVPGVVVNFGTAVLFPTSVTANTIVVTVPGYLVTRADIFPVSVTNPNVSGNSNRILFTVN
jgi:hypothetical protein